uniref:Uncharacterized protein n=1 Tax=Aureoumbra lagunensis TaxID=44058 RepID=A0A7S3K425_9STRA|mmetsp:Transcript_23179/g.29991  ORF Transcript_23179/g.29991 Transcript_23179/m.29991 type:complete len:274 (+) Transcript_23179:45-866(+)
MDRWLGEAKKRSSPDACINEPKRQRIEKRQDYFVLWMIEEEDSNFQKCLKALRNDCDKAVDYHAFQRDGTRHITLCQLSQLTPTEAASVFLDPKEISIPQEQVFVTNTCNYSTTFALSVASTSLTVLRTQVINALREQFPRSIKDTHTQLHISLYRARANSSAREEIRRLLCNTKKNKFNWGRVTLNRIVLKARGAEYTTALHLLSSSQSRAQKSTSSPSSSVEVIAIDASDAPSSSSPPLQVYKSKEVIVIDTVDDNDDDNDMHNNIIHKNN